MIGIELKCIEEIRPIHQSCMGIEIGNGSALVNTFLLIAIFAPTRLLLIKRDKKDRFGIEE